MNWLEGLGLRAVYRKSAQQLRDAVSEIKSHITYEIGHAMAPLQESLDRFFAAVETEFTQIREAQQKALDDAVAALEAADSTNADLTAALQAQIDVNTDLLAGTDAAASRLDAKSAELEANDPVVEPPVDEEPV